MPDQNPTLEYATPTTERYWPWYRDLLFAVAVALLAWSIIDPISEAARSQPSNFGLPNGPSSFHFQAPDTQPTPPAAPTSQRSIFGQLPDGNAP